MRNSEAPFIVAIRGHHHDRESGEPLFDLAQQLQPIHPWHVDVREDDDQGRLDPVGQLLQRRLSRPGEVHHISAVACLSTEALAKKISDIRLATTKMLTLMLPHPHWRSAGRAVGVS